MARTLRVGTRSSPLALRQADWVAERLRAFGASARLELFGSEGDRRQDIPLWRFDDLSPFSGDLDAALQGQRIDLAVHSLKDLPFILPAGLGLVAIGKRADPREALVSRERSRLDDLPSEATVATSSSRRRAQLLHLRPDLRIVDLRGAVGARLAAFEANADWSAILIAAAGLERLGLSDVAAEVFALDRFVPAPGQGAIAITGRLQDKGAATVARRALEHPAVRIAVTAERALVERLETVPGFTAAAHAIVQPDQRGWAVGLAGRLVANDGSVRCDLRIDAVEVNAATAVTIGAALGDRLAAQAETLEL